MNFLVCTAEDLIIQKAISVREKDWEDISGILKRQKNNLDQHYILNWLKEFSDFLERPDILERYDNLKKKLNF